MNVTPAPVYELVALNEQIGSRTPTARFTLPQTGASEPTGWSGSGVPAAANAIRITRHQVGVAIYSGGEDVEVA